MTSDEITQVYAELEQMFVPLDSSPERGMTYIKERLTMARAMADRVAEIRLRVHRALSVAMEDLLIAKQVQEIQPTPDHKQKVRQLEVLKQRHEMLSKMTNMQAQVLSRTTQDIRLLADITKDQIKRREINPDEAPGLVHDVPATDLAGVFKTPAGDFTVGVDVAAGDSESADYDGPEPDINNELPQSSEPGHHYPPVAKRRRRKGSAEPTPAPSADPFHNEGHVEGALGTVAREALAQSAPSVGAAVHVESVQTVGLDAPLPVDDRMRLPDTRTVDFNEVVAQETLHVGTDSSARGRDPHIF